MTEPTPPTPTTNKEEARAKSVAPFIHINKSVNDAPDSLEIGTPAKGGGVKIYGDFNKLDEFKKKIDGAMDCRRYAQAAIEVKL